MNELLRWARCDFHLPHIRVSRHAFVAGQRVERHRHDFIEWFWIESGHVRHHGNGVDEELRSGDARFLGPDPVHGFVCLADSTLVTVSIPQPMFAALRRRYAGSPGWPWPRQGIGQQRLSRLQINALATAVAEVPGRGQDVVDGDWFVATMVRILRQPSQVQRDSAVPPWLIRAVDGMGETRRLAEGLPELVRLSGRSGTHLSREVRRHYGCTATALVNRLRLEQAARDLRLGHRPIADIALACGYGNLGHFYRHFRAAYQVTPRAFRFAAVES